jgi:3-deoxy-D-manno-octulosonic-acid transferase
MSLPATIYDLGLHAARPLLNAVAPFSPKLREGLRGRRGAVERLVDWARSARDPQRPLVWLHAPSVGESLMAQAIISELRADRPNVQVAYTFFSPSASNVARRVGADVVDYLPWDTQGRMERVLDALRPNALAFVRSEIWPTLMRSATERGARTCLVNAVLSASSSRLYPAGRWLLRESYQRLERIGAVALPDAERFSRLGVLPRRVQVTGDARFDQVYARVQQLDRTQPLLQRLRDNRIITIVAGSTWPADEKEIIPAFASARKGVPMRLIIAAHEPTAAHLRDLEQRLDAARLRHARLAVVENGTAPLPDVIIVDRVGVLADLYAVANVAYVGGGFHGAGLHSVIEPAALGVPVIFGPRHGNAREADELAGTGGGFVASDGAAFASALVELADRPMHRATASAAARDFVVSKLGAARKNAQLIAELLEKSAS